MRIPFTKKKASSAPARVYVNPRAGQQPPTFWQKPISFLLYIWYTPVLSLGYKRPLQLEDEFALPHGYETSRVYPQFEADWNRRVSEGKQTEKGQAMLKATKEGKHAGLVYKSILSQHKGLLLWATGLQLLYSAFNFAGPVFLGKIVTFLQESKPMQAAGLSNAYIYASMMFVFPILGAIALVHSSRFSILMQIKVRAELNAHIYRKALRLSTRARQQTETGRVVNLMSNDINNVQQFFYPFFGQLMVAPVTIVAALILLWFQIRWATFIGLAVLTLTTPTSSLFVAKLIKFRRRMLKQTDARVKLMNQLLVGIRVLKLYAWESAQEAAVMEARHRELAQLRKAIPARVGMQTLLFAAPTIAMVAAFAVYGSVDPSRFTAAHIFSSIAYFSVMRVPLIFLPFALVTLGNAWVSARRLSQFLIMEERSDDVTPLPETGLEVVDGNFFWAEPPEDKAGKAKADAKANKKAKRAARMGRLFGRKAVKAIEGKALVVDGAQDSKLTATTESATTNGKSHTDSVANAIADVKANGSVSGLALENGKADALAHKKARGDGDTKLTVESDEETEANLLEGTAIPQGGEQQQGLAEASWWLRDINMKVKDGQLVCVVGRVGCGKSSLISALLGEMEKQSGRVYAGGRVAYVAQQAWIVNDSVVNNITFGKKFEERHWAQVVEACSLSSDLEILPAGEETEIGEKGINLSGGQKQRVSLARALYQDADLYIMDDPLSAVDVHVGRHIFDNCIQGVLKHKARLLVTNQLQYLPHADHIIYMEEGRIAAQGSYDEVNAHQGFNSLLNEYNANAGQEEDDDGSDVEVIEPAPQVNRSYERVEAQILTERLGATKESAVAVSRPRLTAQDTFQASAADEDDIARAASDAVAAHDASALDRRGSLEASDGLDRRGSLEGSSGLDGRNSQEGRGRGTAASRRAFLAMPTMQQQRQEQLEQVVVSARRLSVEASASQELPANASRKSLSAKVLDVGGKDGSRRSIGGSSKAVIQSKLGAREEGKGDLLVVEDRETGQVKGGVYNAYAKLFGYFPLVALLCCWSGEQSLRILTNWWLSQWTAAETVSQILTAEGLHGSVNRGYWIGSYLGLALAFVVMTCTRSAINLYSAQRASRKVHHSSLSCLVRAPISWFDTTPIGRILNRFSKDTDDMDYLLPQSVSEFGNCLMQLLATFVYISVVQPLFLAGIVPLMVLYYFLQKFYRRSYIELQRVDATTRSPIYAHFSESLSGVETLRAYGFGPLFCNKADSKVDYNHRAFHGMQMASQWLSWRLDVIASVLILLVSMLAVATRNTISPYLVALSLTESLDVTGFLKYAVQASAMFESRFNSVERILAYAALPQEAPAILEDKQPPAEWPTAGEIVYEDVWMRYRPTLDPVLKGVSFRVAPQEKVGIVGRTGSGKSSLIISLFRIVEPYQGRITMDGVDLLGVGLDDVRGRIAAIPQDPLLFSGTVRSNLDPYNRHTDAQLWEALAHVNLKEVVGGLTEALGARVAEGGENFSVGQRQLLCVARALLRQPRVLVADEATASVDGETDALIQRTIRANFGHCTVLTIAHRLNTILDSTKVLVMEDGCVKEYDSVPQLMARPDSHFRAMVVEAGLADDYELASAASGEQQ